MIKGMKRKSTDKDVDPGTFEENLAPPQATCPDPIMDIVEHKKMMAGSESTDPDAVKDSEEDSDTDSEETSEAKCLPYLTDDPEEKVEKAEGSVKNPETDNEPDSTDTPKPKMKPKPKKPILMVNSKLSLETYPELSDEMDFESKKDAEKEAATSAAQASEAEAVTSTTETSSGDITSDSDEIDGERDRQSERQRGQISGKAYWAFLIFWGVNIFLCYSIYEVMTTPDSFYQGFLDKALDSDQLPLMLIPRERWENGDYHTSSRKTTYMAKQVAIVQTDTDQCETPEQCAQLLLDLERNQGIMQYNFVISSAGYIFEVLGWHVASPIYPQMPTMVVAFIGDYENEAPTTEQITQLKILLSESEHLKYLDNSYKIIGKPIKKLPNELFRRLDDWSDFDIPINSSDSDDSSLEFEPYMYIPNLEE